MPRLPRAAATPLGAVLAAGALAASALAACTLAAGGAATPAARPDPARQRRDSAAIHDAILRGARGFERGDPAAILAHYAPDVVLAYPGEPDLDRAALERGYARLRARPAGVRATTVPTFDEILVSGDLALVRLRWTTTVAAPAGTTTRRLKDFQLWRREPDGRWAFARGMHYREPEPARR